MSNHSQNMLETIEIENFNHLKSDPELIKAVKEIEAEFKGIIAAKAAGVKPPALVRPKFIFGVFEKKGNL
jgi:hypothetical protein